MKSLLALSLSSMLYLTLALSAQVPGPNVNMVTGTTFPGGDPWLQKQNEPSIAVSTRNPCTLLGGANDYRAVNIPGSRDDKEVGDAWLGLYKSTDCGQTWFSTLVPGYPQDQSQEGLASPVKGLSAGADPTIRSGPAGLFFYSFIAFNRGSNVGKYAVARFVDNNNREGGDPIRYLGTTLIDSGSAGQFLDKPYIAVTSGTGTCSINNVQVPASVVHMAWTVFVGNSDQTIRTKVYYARSSNCGVSLDAPPTKLSEGYPVNQGATVGVSPVDGAVYVAWRQFAADRSTDAVLTSRSVDGGKTFTKAEPIAYLNGFLPFDQATTSRSFRTNAFPTMAVDHTGRVHLAIATRDTTGEARITYLNSTDGLTWTMPQLVDPTQGPGHQIMPSLTYAAGKLHLAWYDLREDEAVKAYAAAFGPFIEEIFPIRHTLDVRGAVAAVGTGSVVSFTPYGILQLPDQTPTPRVSRYLIGNYGNTPGLKQLQFNRPNLKLYAGGSRPFMGDYIDIAGLAFLPVRTQGGGQQWVLNDGTSVLSDGTAAGRDVNVFHAVWTDNRDAKMAGAAPEPASPLEEGALVGYAGAGTPLCGPETAPFTGTRNANVYTSRITPGLFVAVPGNAKPTSCANCVNGRIQRAFGIFVQNTTGQIRTFRLKIENQPAGAGAIASFRQLATAPAIAPTDTELLVAVGPRSSAARSVYVTSAEKYPFVLVTVLEQNVPAGQTPLAGSAILNPDIQNPDIQNPDIQNNEIHNPDIQNPDIQNPDIQNPDIQNPDIQNPDIQNPDIQNPDIQNPDIQNGSLTDVSFDVTNDGNTTSTYQVGVDIDGSTDPYLFQLIGRRVYRTPTALGCQLTEAATNQVLFNIPNPVIDGTLFEPNSPDVRNATIILEPGETIKVTLRAWDKDVLTAGTPPPDDGIQPFCPMIGGLCTTVTHNVTLIVEAQAFNNELGVIDVEGGRPTTTGQTSPFAITSDLPPGGIVGIPYGPVTQETSGGTAPLAWSVSAGSLPTGVTLDSGTGTLSGTPSEAGTFNFTLQVQDSSEPTLTASRPFSIQTLVLAPGDILVSNGAPAATSGSVFSISPDGATTTLVATVPGRPQDIAVDGLRRLIVVDSTNATIRRVTPGRVETIYAGAPLQNPVAVAVENGGDLIVGDNGTDRIYRVAPDGSSIVEIASLVSSTEGQDIQLVRDPSGGVIVVDDEGSTVSVFRVTWDGPATFVSPILTDSTTIQRAGGAALNSAGDLVIADFNQDTIFTVELVEGTIVQTVPVATIGSNMVGVAIDSAGDYIVPINFEAAVKKVTVPPEGAPVISTIKAGSPLTFPTSVVLIPTPPPILLFNVSGAGWLTPERW